MAQSVLAVADTEARESDEDTALPVAKRLVGLFRCSGWGPSCSRIVDEGETRDLRLRQPAQRSLDVGVQDVVGGRKATRTTAARGSRIKFEPFFTLTSGTPTQLQAYCLSWAPIYIQHWGYDDTCGHSHPDIGKRLRFLEARRGYSQKQG